MNDLKKIVIPSLQRDYVQGNQHDKIEPFIEYLLDGLRICFEMLRKIS